jgi:hypothetical protein
MAAKKKRRDRRKTKKLAEGTGRRARVRRYAYRRMLRNPAERAWLTWNHDVDTVMHSIFRNDAIVHRDEMGVTFVPAKLVVQFAEQVADELRAMQDRRRPPGFARGWE